MLIALSSQIKILILIQNYSDVVNVWPPKRPAQNLKMHVPFTNFNLFFFQLSVLKVELSAAEEQCKTLKEDIESRGISKDEMVKKAWEARDAAVQRKNNAQIELAKERVASMQVNSQLLEAIQQKVELAQELENWQTDMEQLLEGQMRQRLLYGEKVTNYRAQSSSAMSTYSDTGSLENGSGNSQPGSRKTSGFLSFFQRT